jgi:biopolymer transport protein ExbB/TolQ
MMGFLTIATAFDIFSLPKYSGAVEAFADKVTQGALQAIDRDGRPRAECPLKHTDVKAEVSGQLARVTVTQKFRNPFQDKIEAVYVFPLPQSEHEVLATLWARARIDELMSQDFEGIQNRAAKPDVSEAITRLGLEYRLMTQFTSFVAVEEITVADGGQPRRIDVPVEAPEGMSRINEAVQNATQYGGGPQAFDWSQMGIWRHMDGVTKVTILILLIMSIWSLVITIERYLTFSAAGEQSREFAPKLASALKSRRIDEAINLSDKYQKSHLATVANAGLQRFRDHQLSDDISGEVIEASIGALQRATASKITEFRRGLSGLATIRSTAAFVGVFGTVFGLIHAFEWLSETSSFRAEAIAGGIAEALLTTAFGLVVAVPVAWLFKYFTGKVDNFKAEMDNSSAELIVFFLKQRDRKDFDRRA